MKRIVLLVFLPCLAATQVPSILKDLSPGNGSTALQDLHALPNNHILFSTVCNPLTLSGLYASDGSTAGTQRVAHFTKSCNIAIVSTKGYVGGTNASGCYIFRSDGTVPGTDSVMLPGMDYIERIIPVNNVIVAVATPTSSLDKVLWRSDGTTGGTYSLMIAGGITTFSVFNNLLYFNASTSAAGIEMHRTDGTTSGTFMLKDIWSGVASGVGNSSIRAVVGNHVYFLANDGITGNELWRTDGSVAGTILLKDINPGSSSSGISDVYAGNNGVYFRASEPLTGYEMWFSDGTASGTQLIADAFPGTANLPALIPVFVGNNAYYFYWKGSGPIACMTDGTSAGTSTLDLEVTGPDVYAIVDKSFRVFNNELYFLTVKKDQVASAGYHDTLCFNKLDTGLTSHTIVNKTFFDFMKAGGNYFTAMPNGYAIKNNSFIYFIGTSASDPHIVIENPVTGSCTIHYKFGTNDPVIHNFNYPVVNNKFYLPFYTQQTEPAYLDLANDSIYKLADVSSGNDAYNCGSGTFTWIHRLHAIGNKGYFLAWDAAYGLEWFGTDFTPSGTQRLKDIYPGSTDFDNNNTQNGCINQSWFIRETPNNIYFGADDGSSGFELWCMYNMPTNPVGIVEKVQSLSVRLFPNPATDKVRVTGKSIRSVTVYNALGAVVAQRSVNGSDEVTIGLTGLVPGVYIVNVSADGGDSALKLVVGE